MLDATALAESVASRELSAHESVSAALATAERDELGCFWALDSDRALDRAVALDRALAKGDLPGRLAGVPFGVKDCFDLAGQPTWCGVRWDAPPTAAAASAAVVDALEREGAIPIGKTSMHQLAWGMSGEAPGFPICRNPVDPSRMPGGSSGGSAAAVSSKVVPLALGSDTGGSVRQPAAWCGVVGYKPSLGVMPLEGCAPLSRSLDTGGVLARSVRDCRLAVTLLNGAAAADADRASAPLGDELRIGIVRELFDACAPGIAERCHEALREAGELRQVTLPSPKRLLGPLYAAELADVWGARVDAQTYGVLEDVRTSIEVGRQVLAVDYLAAHWALRALRSDAAAAVAEVDVVVCPTSPILPPPLGDPDPTRIGGRNTRVFNAFGWPSISIPCGTVEGLPVGILISAPFGRDPLVLAAAERLEARLALRPE